MVGEQKIKHYSCNGFLVLRVEWYGQHGVAIFNESSSAAYLERQAALEQAAIAKGKRITYRFSDREMWENYRATLHESYHSFNLTKSNVIAYVSVCDITLQCYSNQKVLDKLGVETLTKKHLARHILTSWINTETITIQLGAW